jgi:hypothetical protein
MAHTALSAALYSLHTAVPEFIDPVFTKTSPKRSFSVIQNERFGLVFAKTGSIISGTVGNSALDKVLFRHRCYERSAILATVL